MAWKRAIRRGKGIPLLTRGAKKLCVGQNKRCLPTHLVRHTHLLLTLMAMNMVRIKTWTLIIRSASQVAINVGTFFYSSNVIFSWLGFLGVIDHGCLSARGARSALSPSLKPPNPERREQNLRRTCNLLTDFASKFESRKHTSFPLTTIRNNLLPSHLAKFWTEVYLEKASSVSFRPFYWCRGLSPVSPPSREISSFTNSVTNHIWRWWWTRRRISGNCRSEKEWWLVTFRLWQFFS